MTCALRGYTWGTRKTMTVSLEESWGLAGEADRTRNSEAGSGARKNSVKSAILAPRLTNRPRG